MFKHGALQAAFLLSFLVPTAARAQTGGVRFVPDVRGQFYALTSYADAMGFHIGSSPDPSACKHYQAVARVDGPDGTPYLLISRSGNTPSLNNLPDDLSCDDSDGETGKGNLIVVRMGSRDKNGERLRSNRLQKGNYVSPTAPPTNDVAVKTLYFNGQNGLPNFGHPGGMQVVGNTLALAMEHQYQSGQPASAVLFFDISDPASPRLKSTFSPQAQMGGACGVVGLTPLPNGHYLMVATGGKNEKFYFYRSNLPNLDDVNLSWHFVGTAPGPSVTDAHQTLNFLRQGNVNGPLYIAGARGHASKHNDRIDLYRVVSDRPNFEPGAQISLAVEFHGKLVGPYSTLAGERLANLAAASGFYVSPSGEIIFYATEHDNDGPSGTVKMGEWRHKDVVRAGSPTLFPTLQVGGPYDVDEGGGVALTGSARHPLTKPWIQPFGTYNYGESAAVYTIVDYADYARDDFDALAKLSESPYADQVHSWNWYAPAGCSVRAIDHHNGAVDEWRTLAGTGRTERAPDLRQVLSDGGTSNVDSEIDSIQFLDNCRQYYATPLRMQWDTDRNGSYESVGSAVYFSAAPVDGPTEVSVPANAYHPFGGPTVVASARVRVRNVAPTISNFRVTDNAGRQVNTQIPFVLTKLPVQVSASFTDPSALDRQTATLAWGDGAADAQTVFATFNDGYGDRNGAVGHSHRYTRSGSFRVALTVRDDDGGIATVAGTVRVVLPEEGVAEVIQGVNAVLAATTNKVIRKDLETALTALGSPAHGNNGALQKIRTGDVKTALSLLQQATDALKKAQTGGASVALPITLLDQVTASLNAK